MDRRLDPRSIVTPYAFAVHPDLLGKPLATPMQRFGAILVDLVVILFISQIGLAPLAFASTGLLFWLAFRKPGRDALGKVFRVAVGCLGLLVLTGTVVGILAWRYGGELETALSRASADLERDARETLGTDQPSEGEMGLLEVFGGFRDLAALQRAETPQEAQTLLGELAENARDAGLPPDQVRELLGSSIPRDAPWSDQAGRMLDDAMRGLDPEVQQIDVAAEAVPDSSQEDPPSALDPLIEDSIARLNRALAAAEEDRSDLQRSLSRTEQDLQEAREGGFLNWILGFIDDLGIGFGWAALYLTIAHAWWKGTSIGKKLFRIRVVMIDKRPLNWWLSFERAGGYAAGFATGLLGFAQIFWDPNRQAIHDKVSETIVIQDGKPAVPGPWIEEGMSQWNRGRHSPPGTDGS